MNKIKIAIIGAGKIAESAHIPALLKSPDVEFTVIIDNNSSRAQSIIAKFDLNITHVNDLADFKGHLDGAIICTPNDSHVDLCIKCFERRIHVLVEKPLSNTYEEALLIKKKAQEKQCEIMVGYCTRFWPSVQQVKKIIESNTLGKIQKFLFQYGSAGGWAPISNYIMSKEKAGGGAFIINGSHYLDRMIYFFGLPTSYKYFDDSMSGLEANGVAEFSFENGVDKFKGIVRASKTVNLNSGCFIECENGVIMHTDWKSPVLSIKLKTETDEMKFASLTSEHELLSRPDMYLSQLNEFIQRIKGENPDGYISNFDNSVVNVKVTEDLYKNKKPLICNWYDEK